MRRALTILWPAFLVAGVLEMLVFSAFRPSDLRGFDGALTQLSPIGVYTLAFFSFWLVVAVGMVLMLNLALPPRDGEEGKDRG